MKRFSKVVSKTANIVSSIVVVIEKYRLFGSDMFFFLPIFGLQNSNHMTGRV